MVTPRTTTDGTHGAPSWPSTIALSAAGTSLVLALPADALPSVVHWGGQLEPADAAQLDALAQAARGSLATNGIDGGVVANLLTEAWTGWTGTPGLVGHRPDGTGWAPRFTPKSIVIEPGETAGGAVEVHADDEAAGLGLRLRIELLPTGIARLQAEVTNLLPGTYLLESLSLALPVPTRADRIIDFAGRWAKERVYQERGFTVGSFVREGRHGRTGADAATVLLAGTEGLDFESGEGWGIHLGFSGNHRVIAERAYSGERLLIGGELLLPGEIILATGESYQTPWLYAVHGHGLDELAARFHDYLRARPTHPSSPRPVVMNSWEAVYFDHGIERITPLIERAAAIGVERFVLDDGWFGSRRDDQSGLGDWQVSGEVWGGGDFAELVRGVKQRGMEFGLWFEPEMVNLDSDVARAHPDWILQVPGRLPVTARNQQVLNLTIPEAFAHVRDRIVDLVTSYGIDQIKWDHNRDLVDAGSCRTGRAVVHEQTLAAYRLLDEIRAACPGLEIESCSSGGARVDLGILERTDRVWASDCIDAHERQQIQRWTAQLLPPELVGSHVGSGWAHTTGRQLDLGFRAATALFGHFGIEWDLTAASPDELAGLAAWVAYYKQVRQLIHTGRMVRRELEDGALWLTGAVRPDQSEALFMLVVRERPITWPAGQVLLPGLDPDRMYRVQPAGPDAHRFDDPAVTPGWWADGLRLSGRMLGTAGIQMPALHPDRAALIHVRADDE